MATRSGLTIKIVDISLGAIGVAGHIGAGESGRHRAKVGIAAIQ